MFKKITPNADWDTNISVHQAREAGENWSKIASLRRKELESWHGPDCEGMIKCSRCHDMLCLHSGCTCAASHKLWLFDGGFERPETTRRYILCPHCADEIQRKMNSMQSAGDGGCKFCHSKDELREVNISTRPDRVAETFEACSTCYSDIHHVIYDVRLVATTGIAGWVEGGETRVVSDPVSINDGTGKDVFDRSLLPQVGDEQYRLQNRVDELLSERDELLNELDELRRSME